MATKKTTPAKQRAARPAGTWWIGDKVLLEVKHLHGVCASITEIDGTTATVRIEDGGFEGFIAQFPTSVLVALDHPKVQTQHTANLATFRPEQEKPESPLHVNPQHRLPWNYSD